MTTKRRPPPRFVFDCRVFSTPLSSRHQCPRVSMAAARAQRRIIPRIHPSTPVDTQGRGARYDAVPLLLLIVAYFFPVDCRGRWRHGRNGGGGGGKDARDVVAVAVLSPPRSSPRFSSLVGNSDLDSGSLGRPEFGIPLPSSGTPNFPAETQIGKPENPSSRKSEFRFLFFRYSGIPFITYIGTQYYC